MRFSSCMVTARFSSLPLHGSQCSASSAASSRSSSIRRSSFFSTAGLCHSRPPTTSLDTAFDVFGFLAVLTNAAVFIFAGHTFDSWLHSQKIALFLTIEFSTIFLRILISVVLPPIPRRVRLLQLQQDVMVHRHMDLGGEEDDHETRASAMRTTVQPPPYVFDKDQEDDDLW